MMVSTPVEIHLVPVLVHLDLHDRNKMIVLYLYLYLCPFNK
jgi:hypothetical protein